MSQAITVETVVHAPMEVVWEVWNNPEHIQVWYHASDDWKCPKAVNDFRVGGAYIYTMTPIDQSTSFDLQGTYTNIVDEQQISSVLADGRKVDVVFTEVEGGVHIAETFDMENENPADIQAVGWQAILDNFKMHAENMDTKTLA